MAILRNQGEQSGWQCRAKATRTEEIIQRLNLFRIYISEGGFTSVGLPGIRRVSSRETGCQNSLCVRAGAASDGCIDKLNIWILRLEDFDHRGQAICLARANPPGEDFYLGLGGCSAAECRDQ